MAEIGHNRGPSMEPGLAWRSHCWKAAREALLPTLPIEVVRLRVKRAQDLGLDYKTYASVRAATGHDLVAFLFSSNALRLVKGRKEIGPQETAKLLAMDCARIGLATAPLRAQAMAQNTALDAAHPAPFALASFPQTRALIREALGKTPSDRVLLVGDLPLEREWCAAGRLAGYLPAERFFARA
ncbi:MAG: hypothetical protein ACOH2M_04700 [Cypionkella sp.]|jgi:hypothetical protein